jgi:DNA-binding Xre family transcriptional regulator
MKKLRSNIEVLIAQKNQEPDRAGRRVSLRSLAKELGISRYTIYAFRNNVLDEYPRDMLEKLCIYFGCDIGDLMSMRTTIDTTDPALAAYENTPDQE